MTILFLARRFYPEIGGVEKHVLEIGKRLVKKGHRVVVITENPQKPHSVGKQSDLESAKIAGKVEGIEIYRINGGKNDWYKKFRVWLQLWKHAKLISDADIVHCHDVFFWYLPFRFLFPEKKVYITFHGYEGFPIKIKAVIIRKISEKLSNGNICIGKFIEKYYKTKANFVLYGGVDVPETISNYKDKLSGVFVGRLEEVMGIKTYLNIFKTLKTKGFKFSIVGDGEYRKQVEKQFKVEGFKNNITGYIQNNHFAFVSGYLTILETMANKRLVFAVSDSLLREDYLKMTPYKDWIIVEKDAESVVKKVEYYISHPDEETIIVNKAYDWAKTQTWDRVVKTYLELWGV